MRAYPLDKSLVRRIIEGLRHPSELTDEEALAIALWRRLRQAGHRLFISVETENILQGFSALREVQTFLASVETMEAGKYFKRWARRLREYGFSSEDTKVLSLGTFGTDESGNILGVEAIITLDRAFINNFEANLFALRERLKAVTVNLSAPFCGAVLPELKRPEELLALGEGIQ
ncbi:MAG TPA: hypothetical protein EYP49_10340 [Anaerolineae bacterium]|nr:hypothetical protein [Anaerolineae bacterium]